MTKVEYEYVRDRSFGFADTVGTVGKNTVHVWSDCGDCNGTGARLKSQREDIAAGRKPTGIVQQCKACHWEHEREWLYGLGAPRAKPAANTCTYCGMTAGWHFMRKSKRREREYLLVTCGKVAVGQQVAFRRTSSRADGQPDFYDDCRAVWEALTPSSTLATVNY